MRSSRRANRGTLMLGMAALILVLATLCGAVLVRSMDVYRSTALSEQRLQAQGAAEGAIVLLLRNDGRPPTDLEIGTCRVRFGEASMQDGRTDIPMTVEVFRGADRPVFSRNYVARFERGPSGSLQFLEMVTKP